MHSMETIRLFQIVRTDFLGIFLAVTPLVLKLQIAFNEDTIRFKTSRCIIASFATRNATQAFSNWKRVERGEILLRYQTL